MSDGELQPLPVSSTSITRRALIAAAVAEVRAGRSIRSAAKARGLPTSTVRSAVIAAGTSSPISLVGLVSAIAVRLDALEVRLAALERGRKAEESASSVRAALDSIPSTAFDDLPGAEPGPSHSRMASNKSPGNSGLESDQ